MTPPSLTLALLMFNEEDAIDAAIAECVAYCEARIPEWEIIVVDDGSTDGSAGIVRGWSERESRVRLAQHPVNRGMGAGMSTAIQNVRTEYFVFFPADRQIDPYELDKMLPLLAEADIVTTVYGNKRERVRRFISDGLRLMMRLAVGIRFKLQGLYLYPTIPAQALEPRIGADTFFFSFELVHRGVEQGLSIVCTEIECKPRETGSSKIFNLARIRRVGNEVMAYRKRRRQERRA